MAYAYTLANAKGGCGKSTVALNLAVCFARNGQRTLAIDLDQQGNLSAALGVDLNDVKFTAHWLLINDEADISSCLLEARPRLKLLPNTIDIQADDLLEATKVNRELLLKKKLRPVLRDFDIVIIDTPPAMRAATLNGLAVADTVLIPVDSSYFAPSRKKIELSALIIDQVQPLPGIVSHPAGSEPKHHPSPPRLEKTAAIHGPISNQEAIFSERCSPLRLPSTHSHSMPSTERSDSTSPPAKTFLRQRLVRIQRVQDGLTMAEQRVLNHLWEKGEKESSATSRVLTVAQKGVAFATHLSVVSVRANLRSLESKLCIEESASFNVTEHLGRTYRVYSFASILDRWRRTGCLWARQTRGIELLKSPTPWLAGESLAPQDASQDSSVAQVSLAAQLSSTPQHSSRRSSQLKRDQLSAPLSFLSSPDHEDSSAPQLSLPPQDSSTVPKSPDFSRISGFPKESLPAPVSSAPEDSSPPQLSCTHSITCPREQESSAPQDSLPFIETENKQIKQSSTSSTVSLTEFPKTLEALAEFPASHLADDGIVCHMLSQILTNTPNASDTEIADFIRHKGKEIKNPKTSFMACLSAMVVSAMQGHRMVLYRQQRQREQEQREATRRKEFEGTVRYSEFFAAKLEQHLAGQTVDPLTLRTAIGFLQFHLPQLPKPLQERVAPALQSLSTMQPNVSVHSHPP